jgi:hypothetical protein
MKLKAVHNKRYSYIYTLDLTSYIRT